MIHHFKFLHIFVIVTVLSACGSARPNIEEPDKIGSNTNNSENLNNTPSDIQNKAQFQSGADQWQSHYCGSCHGNTGDGYPSGISLVPSLERGDAIHLTTTTMPYEIPAACDKGCSEDIITWLEHALSIASESMEI